MPDQYKPVAIKPLNGVLDTRAMPEDMASGYVRERLNFQINAAGKMGRSQGWEKFLSKTSGYNNEDLHDQMEESQIYYDEAVPPVEDSEDVRDYPPGASCSLVRQVRTQGREHPTLLFQAISTAGIRYQITGVQSRLYELNVATGAQRILCDGLGGTTSDTLSVRFRVGQVKDTLVFSNDVDQPFSYTLGDEINGCAMRATRPIPDLDLIKLSKAREVIAFKGHIILLNVAMDGGRLENRFVWSDYMLGSGSLRELVPGSATTNENDPRSYRADVSFDPAITDTIAGYDELPAGHKILRAIEFNRRILVFTNRGIFAIDDTGSADRKFVWTELYKQPDGARCLKYPNTLINCGDRLLYMGGDGIYKWDAFTVEPEREEWLHRGTGDMYANLNRDACETHCAGYTVSDSESGEERSAEFSYAEAGHDVPNKTLRVWIDQRFVSPGDYGMTAYGNCQPDSRPSINDFVRQYCICPASELSQQEIKAGLPATEPVCSDGLATSLCATPPTETLAEFTPTNYNSEGSAIVLGLTDGAFYLVEFGVNDTQLVTNTGPGDPGSVTIGASGFFTNRGTVKLRFGTPSAEITAIFTLIENGVPIEGTTLYTEDFDAEICDEDSLCARLNGLKLDDICLGCEGPTLFIGASSRDKCIKTIGVAYSREFCINSEISHGALNGFAHTNFRGVYTTDGYYSELIIGPHALGDKTAEKNIRSFMLELEAMPELVRNCIALTVGYSYSPLDPSDSTCGVVWGVERRRELSCPQALATSEYRAKNLRPHQGKHWEMFVTGRYLYFKIVIAGLAVPSDLKSALIPCKGGESYFSSAAVEARKA